MSNKKHFSFAITLKGLIKVKFMGFGKGFTSFGFSCSQGSS